MDAVYNKIFQYRKQLRDGQQKDREKMASGSIYTFRQFDLKISCCYIVSFNIRGTITCTSRIL
jgi:hypothetical protein